MAKPKYSLEKRLAVVTHVLSGKDGTQRTAERFGVERTSVRRWVKAYHYHGIAGLVPQRTVRHPEFRLFVVQAVLDEQLSMREAAARFNIPNEMAVQRWMNVYRESGLEGLLNIRKGHRHVTKKIIPHPLAEKDPEALSPEELRSELRYLRAENAYLKKLRALVQSEKNGKKPG